MTDFGNARGQWLALLERSDANHLFLSWEWQYTWWETFAKDLGLELLLLAAYDDQNGLIGLAPLYRRNIRMRKVVNIDRIEFIGNCWHGAPTMRTEDVDFIAARELHGPISRAFMQHLIENEPWDEFVIHEMKLSSPTRAVAIEFSQANRLRLREADTYHWYYVTTQGDFLDYVSGRGRNTRLKLYNRRKLLDTLGEVGFGPCEDVDKCFDTLNDLHKLRWHKDIFEGSRMDFNRSVAEMMAKRNALKFSILSVDHKPVSILFDYQLNGEVYNIQAGFDEGFHKKIALGTLHFGYAIEEAFQGDTTQYHFMAGEGKNTQYKERLTDEVFEMTSLQLIRSKKLRLLYAGSEMGKSAVRKFRG